MAVRISRSPDVCCYITWGNRTNATWVKKRKKKISECNHSRYVALNSPDHSPFDSICSVMQQQVYWTLLRMSMNSRSNWLKSEAEHYQHCYQRIENASPCLHLHKWPIFENLLSAVAQLDSWINCHNQSARNLDKMCQICVIWIK